MTALRRTSLKQGPPGPPGPPGTVKASVAWNIGSLNDGAKSFLNITITGATVGFPAWAAWGAALPDGVWLSAQVTATNTVRVMMVNNSGSVQTLNGTIQAEALTS